jgi:hypothetical protein
MLSGDRLSLIPITLATTLNLVHKRCERNFRDLSIVITV